MPESQVGVIEGRRALVTERACVRPERFRGSRTVAGEERRWAFFDPPPPDCKRVATWGDADARGLAIDAFGDVRTNPFGDLGRKHEDESAPPRTRQQPQEVGTSR